MLFRSEGPGYFATFLERHDIAWRLVRIDAGDAVPASLEGCAGLVFMGGPMSVNDDLPWIAPVLDLIRRAVAADVPVLGHCLGGQLLSKALGGTVGRNPVKEIGWGEVSAAEHPLARRWLGGVQGFLSFHWHGETFSIPEGATLIASSAWCPNQAFVLGPHLGMQCHVEMTPELIRAWCEDWATEVANLATRTASVQPPDEILRDLDARVKALNAVAAKLYDRWIEALVR